ncbi:MAG: hypothetical protein M0Z99_01905 [Betaproteobacteria bacterium]|nr:hypothetical protein [Betaproteobacteria bacterium]
MKRRTKAIVEAERQALLGTRTSVSAAEYVEDNAQPAIASSVFPEEDPAPLPPSDWRKGALLNVRNYGAEYVVTLYPEEVDQEHPERALRFTNVARCQDFISAWYARESPDPRALR